VPQTMTGRNSMTEGEDHAEPHLAAVHLVTPETSTLHGSVFGDGYMFRKKSMIPLAAILIVR
jgi:hypothetical protein